MLSEAEIEERIARWLARGAISPRLANLYRRFGGHCFYCDIETSCDTSIDACPSRDHFVPRSKGGGHGVNLVLACHRCNNEKGDLTGSAFLTVLHGRRMAKTRLLAMAGRSGG